MNTLAPATSPSAARTLTDPDTPFAVVDIHKTRRDIERLAAKADRLAVALRPHVKTAKSLDAAALLHDGSPCPITASTLAEAEAFAGGGYTDITYAVGIDPHKLPRVLALLRRGVTLRILLDSTAQAESVAEASRQAGLPVPTQIEIDCDGHRGGLRPDAPAVVKIGRILHDAGCLDGGRPTRASPTSPARPRNSAWRRRTNATPPSPRPSDCVRPACPWPPSASAPPPPPTPPRTSPASPTCAPETTSSSTPTARHPWRVESCEERRP
ncbi:hypothetical protein HDA41_007565 [Streptomyces caelestis]|uniref:Alanine racemase N-terminal domain-containing protein n=1 Tax=Streptomyces caelestis TaxID=36816 RepID=A0A7W9LXC8_9ACTN|nr:hypothetical protein [Streptomyces caelestis]